MQFGKWHELVPRDPVENVKFRLALYKRARGDKAFQASVRAICARDPLFYIATFAWQFNPNAEGGDEFGPFVPWDWQDRFILRLGEAAPAEARPGGREVPRAGPVVAGAVRLPLVEIEGEKTRVKALQFAKEPPEKLPPGVVVSGKFELWIVPDSEGQLPRDRYTLGSGATAQGAGPCR